MRVWSGEAVDELNISGGGGHIQNRASRSSPPSLVVILQIQGEVEARYVQKFASCENDGPPSNG